jgi:hypothetical protein
VQPRDAAGYCDVRVTVRYRLWSQPGACLRGVPGAALYDKGKAAKNGDLWGTEIASSQYLRSL